MCRSGRGGAAACAARPALGLGLACLPWGHTCSANLAADLATCSRSSFVILLFYSFASSRRRARVRVRRAGRAGGRARGRAGVGMAWQGGAGAGGGFLRYSDLHGVFNNSRCLHTKQINHSERNHPRQTQQTSGNKNEHNKRRHATCPCNARCQLSLPRRNRVPHSTTRCNAVPVTHQLHLHVVHCLDYIGDGLPRVHGVLTGLSRGTEGY